jgi:Histidine kinase-like ATPase domain
MRSPGPERQGPGANEGGDDGHRRFVLQLAPEPSLVMTARLFASHVARMSGCPEERVEDVKLAISEACAAILKVGTGDRPVRIQASPAGDRLLFEVGPASNEPGAGVYGGRASLPQGFDLIRLIFDDVRTTAGREPRHPSGGHIAFTVPVSHDAI